MNSIKDLLVRVKEHPRTELRSASRAKEGLLAAVRRSFGIEELPKEVEDLYSEVEEGFIGIGENDSWRILSPRAIVDAEKDLNVAFTKKHLVPLIDCMDNIYVCYNTNEHEYVMFNIVDELSFGAKDSFAEFFPVA